MNRNDIFNMGFDYHQIKRKRRWRHRLSFMWRTLPCLPCLMWWAVRRQRHLASHVCTTATFTVTRNVSHRPTSVSNRITPISAFSALARSVSLNIRIWILKMCDAHTEHSSTTFSTYITHQIVNGILNEPLAASDQRCQHFTMRSF